MGDDDKKPENTPGPQSGFPQKKIVYAVIAVAVVILAVVLVAKFGYNTDLLNPAGGQMSLVQRPDTLVRANVTTSGQQPQLRITPAFQKVTTPMARWVSCTADQTNCNAVCVYLKTDSKNCGTCGVSCSGAYSCRNGNCVSDPPCAGVVCGEGYSCCGGRCVPNAAVPNNPQDCGY